MPACRAHAGAAGPCAGVVFLLALTTLCLGPLVVCRPAAAAEVYVISPHTRSRCSACHVSEDDETFLDEDMNALCSRCHDQADPQWKHHPLRKVPADMKVPEYWPVAEEAITCITCHTPGHEEDRDIPMLLRDGPYPQTDVFCRACHPRAGKGARDPHLEVNVGLKGCPVCHDRTPVSGEDTFQTVSFVARLRILCLMCHDYLPHPGGVDHCHLQPGRRDTIVPRSLRDLEKQVTCISCHNPHVKENEGFKLRDAILGVETCWKCHDK